MNNASIHTTIEIAKMIKKRGHHCRYLPPYSPFLNPIEEYWSKVKYDDKRGLFDTLETLSSRIHQASSFVTLGDCRGWARHSISYFPGCLAQKNRL